MPSQSLPIKGQTLRWARDLRGYSLERAADELDMSVGDLRACEAGNYPFTLGLLDNMGRVYKQTRSALLRAKPPPLDPPPKYFRSQGGKPVKPSPDLLLIIREARHILDALRLILKEDSDLFPRAHIAKCTVYDEIEQVAEDARTNLGFKHGVPRVRTSRAKAYKHRRSLLELSGVFVFQRHWDSKNGIGASLFDEGSPPSIIVNTHSQDYHVRSFTLFHEYAHLLLHEPGGCDRTEGTEQHAPIEHWCNRVAAAMLMPRSALLTEVDRKIGDLRPKDWELSDIRKIASSFRVSLTAAGIRLKTCGVTDAIDRYSSILSRSDRQSERLEQDVSKTGPKSFGGGPRIHPGHARFYQVGFEVADVFLKALESNVIDTRSAATSLGLTGSGLRAFAEKTEGERTQIKVGT